MDRNRLKPWQIRRFCISYSPLTIRMPVTQRLLHCCTVTASGSITPAEYGGCGTIDIGLQMRPEKLNGQHSILCGSAGEQQSRWCPQIRKKEKQWLKGLCSHYAANRRTQDEPCSDVRRV